MERPEKFTSHFSVNDAVFLRFIEAVVREKLFARTGLTMSIDYEDDPNKILIVSDTEGKLEMFHEKLSNFRAAYDNAIPFLHSLGD